MTVYGGEVCPFIDSLTLLDWGRTLLIFFSILFVVRYWVIQNMVLKKPLVLQPRVQMVAEFWLFIAAGIAIGLYNNFVYDFPPFASGGKVSVGMITLGSFLAIDMALFREREVILEARVTGQRFSPSKGFKSLTKKFTLFALLVLTFVAVVIMLVISKDVYWIAMSEGKDLAGIKLTLAFEISFVVAVVLGLVLNLIFSYSRTLSLFFENETLVLTDVNQGNLDGYVPVVSRDEFAQIASHTNQMIDGLREKRRIQNAFGKIVSPDVASELLSENREELLLGGERRELVILLSDVRGFTSMTEQYEPEQMVSGLNRYFSDMVQVIHEEKGIVDKFIGDGILAIFGLTDQDNAPTHAVNSALRMLEICMQNNDSYGLPIKMGIGIHAGEVIIGNIGSKDRLEYTAIGDAVNIAARLESITKDLDVPLVISESLLKKCESIQQALPWQEYGAQELKGKQEKVEVLGLSMDQLKAMRTF
jgi:adenylate cyclase